MSLDRPKLQHESIEDGEMFEARKAFTQSDDDGVAMLIIIIRVILRKKVMTGIFYGIVINVFYLYDSVSLYFYLYNCNAVKMLLLFFAMKSIGTMSMIVFYSYLLNYKNVSVNLFNKKECPLSRSLLSKGDAMQHKENSNRNMLKT